MKKNVLISVPSYIDSLVYLPYIHALLKSECLKHEEIVQNFEWMEPIFLNSTADQLLKGRESNINVLGLSCYLWNWNVNLEIARRVKAANPDVLIIMGGPHPDWNDRHIFEKHPDIDIIVKYDGELAFARILKESLKDNPDYSSIPGLVVPGSDGLTVHTDGEILRVTDWDPKSVYLHCEDIPKLIEKYKKYIAIGAVWETNRGCPYKCNFCDWGSATYTKVRKVPESRLKEDQEFFGKCKVDKIFIADANFGIFPRDVELAEGLARTKEEYGYPNLLYWAMAKNKADSIAKISKIFMDSGLDDSVCFSLQSTQEKTILEMGRGARSLKVHHQLNDMVDEVGAPKLSQIMMGAPGESKEGFIATLHDSLTMNFHKSAFMVNFTMLPNAPISQPGEKEKYNIKTIVRPANRTRGLKKNLWKWHSGAEEIIVGHDEMSVDDWIYMSTYKIHIMSLHHLGLTRFVARYLKNVKGISYEKIYKHLFKMAFADQGKVGDSFRRINDHFRDYTTNPNAIYAIPGFDPEFYIDHESAQFCDLIACFPEFTEWLRESIITLAESEAVMDDSIEAILKYQEAMTITPEYNCKVGKTFESDYDFNEYFTLLKERDTSELKVNKKPVRYIVKEYERDFVDRIAKLYWRDEQGEIDLITYQNIIVPGAFRRYMSTPVFEPQAVLTVDLGLSKPAVSPAVTLTNSLLS